MGTLAEHREKIKGEIVELFHTSPEEAVDMVNRIESISAQMLKDIVSVINSTNTVTTMFSHVEPNNSALVDLVSCAIMREDMIHKKAVDMIASLSPIIMLKAYLSHLNIEVEVFQWND
jgi:hypothetical protein